MAAVLNSFRMRLQHLDLGSIHLCVLWTANLLKASAARDRIPVLVTHSITISPINYYSAKDRIPKLAAYLKFQCKFFDCFTQSNLGDMRLIEKTVSTTIKV